jgi:hypothetical protein
MARIIQSPGVQISEVDLSLRAVGAPPTTVFISGFASKGPAGEPINVGSLSEFEQIFGTPTNSAEKYFYHSVKAVTQSPADIMVYRLPYGEDRGLGYGSTYSALVYPATAYNAETQQNTSNFEIASGAYLFGEPTHVKLTEDQYLSILRGEAFSWSASGTVASFNDRNLSELGRAGLIILNKAQSTINTKYEGYYVGIIDNSNLNPATNFDGITKVLSLNNTLTSIAGNEYVQVPSARLNFNLSASSEGVTDSMSEVMENLPSFNIDTRVDDDTIAVGVFKLRQSVFSPDTIALDYILEESYVGSLDSQKQIFPTTGGGPVSFFLEAIDDSSRNIITLVNPYISNKQMNNRWDNDEGLPKRKVRFLSGPRLQPIAGETSGDYLARMGAPVTAITGAAATIGTTNALFAVSDYINQDLTTKVIGNVPRKVVDMFDKIENSEIYPLSITCEAGLGTIYLNSLNPATSGYFDDTVPFPSAVNSLTGQNLNTIPAAVQEYLSVVNEFVTFANDARKDHLFIADPITNIFVQGDIKTLDDPTKNFSQNIYWPLRNQFSTINSSYVTTFANVAKVADLTTNRQMWVPFSGFAAAAMGNTDATYYPWYAPAGFTRGIVTGITDLALYPKQKQRDLLYKISMNPVVFFPNEGFVIFGQKTMLKRPSAFDRINVRRLFLYLEVQTKNTAKFFVFEPNTLFTRTNVKNVLSPIFDLAKNTQGVYDYLIICDERNNTPAVIDDNSLVVDIYIKPVRSAEFILVNFYATRTGANFQEIVA